MDRPIVFGQWSVSTIDQLISQVKGITAITVIVGYKEVNICSEYIQSLTKLLSEDAVRDGGKWANFRFSSKVGIVQIWP